MKRIAIIGSGDLGKQLLNLISSAEEVNVVGFFDDFAELGELINNTPVIGKLNQIEEQFLNDTFDELICAIGYKYLEFKFSLCQSLERKNIPFYSFIHKSALIDPTAKIEQGCCIYPGVIIDQNVVVRKHSLINLGAIISHDTVVGKACFISPNVSVAGFCKVGDFCILGISSTIIDNIDVCNSVQLGAGSLVINNIKEAGLYVGSPSRKIK